MIEKETMNQAKGKAFYRHRAGRIGASRSKAASHSDPSQPSQSLIKTICYPDIFKFSSAATRRGCKHEPLAIKKYENEMKLKQNNFQVKQCGTFINKEYPFLHSTPDFLCSCDCCGLGCGEVKCPYCIDDLDFDNYLFKKSSCLERNEHTGNSFWDSLVPKLCSFWRTCILPEILGRWYTRKLDLPVETSHEQNSDCYCQKKTDESTVTCSNPKCPVSKFHLSCLAIERVPKTWYCPHCRKLPEFKVKKPKSETADKTHLLIEAVELDSICICEKKASSAEKLLNVTIMHAQMAFIFIFIVWDTNVIQIIPRQTGLALVAKSIVIK